MRDSYHSKVTWLLKLQLNQNLIMINSKSKASFDSQNKSLKLNDYSIGIAIPLFGRDIFFGITIPLQRVIAISLNF
jgi:hypothetical protein